MSFALTVADARIAVIGLGYVGLPLAAALGRDFSTLGYDLNPARIAQLQAQHDATEEITSEELGLAVRLRFSADAAELKSCNVYIVAVPTPVTAHKWPDLTPLIAASDSIGRVLTRGALVIYESTVYPGATEEVCVPALERASGLRCNEDFLSATAPNASIRATARIGWPTSSR